MDTTSTNDDAGREERLLAMAGAGDEDAFRMLFDPHVDLLLGRIRRSLPAGVLRKVSTADVLQEVRIAAFTGLPEFDRRGDGALLAWLLKIAENRTCANLRTYARTAKRSNQREVSRPNRPETAAFEGGGRSPSEAAMAAEDRGSVREALALLPEDYRQVLELVFTEQLSLREVGERMGRSREAAKKLYGRALARFAETIERESDDVNG